MGEPWVVCARRALGRYPCAGGGVGRAADLAFSSAVEKVVVKARGGAGTVVPSARVTRLMMSHVIDIPVAHFWTFHMSAIAYMYGPKA